PLTPVCDASQGATSAGGPVSRFTTPPGRSEVARTSPGVAAGIAPASAVITTALLPETTTGASTLTRPRRPGRTGDTSATTPVGCGIEKLKKGPETGF